ncbi:hypothetical protein [Streptomyces corynorhini]|nr:hypothetical protein [Streptomyces corynorhini]
MAETEQERAARAYREAAPQRDPARVRDAQADAKAAGSNAARTERS